MLAGGDDENTLCTPLERLSRVVILIVVVGAGFYFTGNVGVLLGVLGPAKRLGPGDREGTLAPNYADASSWAALPTKPWV